MMEFADVMNKMINGEKYTQLVFTIHEKYKWKSKEV